MVTRLRLTTLNCTIRRAQISIASPLPYPGDRVEPPRTAVHPARGREARTRRLATESETAQPRTYIQHIQHNSHRRSTETPKTHNKVAKFAAHARSPPLVASKPAPVQWLMAYEPNAKALHAKRFMHAPRGGRQWFCLAEQTREQAPGL